MNQPVTILRYTECKDIYGDPIPGTWAEHLTVSGKVAPNNPSEPVEVGRNAVITGGTVYIRNETILDITAKDRVKIRDVTYEIDGEVGIWPRRHEYGHQFAYLKKVG